jgi:hypothetical protein
MRKSELTRLWNHLMRMEDKEFEHLFQDARMQRTTNKFYEKTILQQLKQQSVLYKTINARN